VALFDDNQEAGGQVYRAPYRAPHSVDDACPDAPPVSTHFHGVAKRGAAADVYAVNAVFDRKAARQHGPSADALAGDELRSRLSASDVDVYFDHQVWAVTGDFRVDAIGPEGPMHCEAAALIVASGTTERVVPFEGWTLPGVIGLAAATILLKSQRILPGRTTLVAGCGPLLAAVAAKTIEGGGSVVALADIAGKQDWVRTAPAMLSRTDLMRQGWTWWRKIQRAGTPILSRHTIECVEAYGDQLRATLAPCDAVGRPIQGTRKIVMADCVAVGHGLTPSSDITRSLRVDHHYSRKAGGWVARADPYGRTSRRGLYVAGDGAGIGGAHAAALHGQLAGLACAQDTYAQTPGHTPARGRKTVDIAHLPAQSSDNLSLATQTLDAHLALRVPRRYAAQPPLQAALATVLQDYRRAARFGHAMGSLMALRVGHIDSILPHTVVCRCEDVTRAEIDAACDAGAHDVNQLKAWTRCGMGPCQGRSCGDVAAELLARRIPEGSRERVGCFSARTPLRPLTIEALTGTFTYDDIPMPQAAPL
jgi:bacterioferritin-associated ferredoxin